MTTVVTKTVGAVGRDYSTLAAWEADTDNNLVALDELQVGNVYDDADFTAFVTLNGATVDAARYRVLRAAAGEEYEPISGVGVYVIDSTSDLIRVDEEFGVIQGIGSEVSLGGVQNFQSTAVGQTLYEKCVGINILPAVGSNMFFDAGTGSIFRRCIAIAGGATGGNRGFASQVTSKLAHCTADNPGAGVTPLCYISGQVLNCIGTRAASADYSGIPVSPVSRNNASSDATAPATGAIINLANDLAYRDAENRDFRPMRHSPHIEAGTFVIPRKPFLFEQSLVLTAVRPTGGIDLTNGLVCVLPMTEGEGTALADLSGEGNNGTATGTVAWVRDLPGTCTQFSAGVPGDGIDLVDQVDGPTGVTIAVWFQGANASVTQGLAENFVGGVNGRWYLQLDGTTPYIKWVCVDDDGVRVDITTPGAVQYADGEWHLAIGVYDGIAHQSRLYVDGQLLATGTGFTASKLNSSLVQPPQVANLGAGLWDFIGEMAAFMAWNRPLTGAEITYLHLHPWALMGVADETDFAGVTVPQGSQRSMGAYEESPTPAQPKTQFASLLGQNMTMRVT